MKFVDLHCDTLMRTYIEKKPEMYSSERMVSFEKMKAGGQLAQFFAMWMLSPDMEKRNPGITSIPDEDYITALHATFRDNLEKHSEDIRFAGNAADIEENEIKGKMSAFLAIEDGRSVEGSLDNIKRYYDMGVRLITLTWNYENCFGYPSSNDPEAMQKGLKSFGKEAVRYMNKLGIIVDVSHLSDGGFKDVAMFSSRPFVASHSNCRALSPHRRNLTDGMIKTLADHGGVAGLNFAPPFLAPDCSDKFSSMEMMSAHIRHMIKVGGSDVAALGSDFDGIDGEIEVADSSRMGLLLERLQKDGIKSSVVEKVAFGNALRVIGASMQ